MKHYICIMITSARFIIAELCNDNSCGADYHFITDVQDRSVGRDIVNAMNSK